MLIVQEGKEKKEKGEEREEGKERVIMFYSTFFSVKCCFKTISNSHYSLMHWCT